MKTAVASPDEGPDKKKYGIPPKDKKGLPKKNEYKYESKHLYKSGDREKKKEDPGYEKFKRDYKAPEGRYNGYKAPDGSWHGSPGSESAIKAHYKWSKMSPDERKKTRERNESEHQMAGRKISAPKDKPKPKSDQVTVDRDAVKRLVARKASYKVVENKIKKPEDKEKANKLTKKASRSKTPIRMKNKKDK